MKTRKYTYERVMQQNNGCGWDDLDSFETNSDYLLTKHQREELNHLWGEYKIAQPTAPLRTINRRTQITEQV